MCINLLPYHVMSSLHCSLVDVDDPSRGQAEGVGFLFDSERPSDAIAALARAVKRVVSERSGS